MDYVAPMVIIEPQIEEIYPPPNGDADTEGPDVDYVAPMVVNEPQIEEIYSSSQGDTEGSDMNHVTR